MIPSGGSIGNTVIINSGDIPKNAYGAVAGDGQIASENRLFMYGGSVTQLVGAYATTGNAENNTVLVDGGTVNGHVVGADIESTGQAFHNSVVITAGEIASNCLGASTDSGDAVGNSVLMSGGSARNLYGANSYSGKVVGNTATLTGGSARWIMGAYSDEGTAIGNKVIVTGGTVNGVSGAETAFGNAIGNSVHFDNATTDNINGGYVDNGIGSACGNSIVIDGGTIEWSVVGGNVYGQGDAVGNIVVVNGGKLGEMKDGFIGSVMGGQTRGGNAAHNIIIMNGGFAASLTGGYAVSSGSTAADAIGNYVLVNGGTMDSEVVGGNSEGGSASGNTVEIRGGNLIGPAPQIIGGRADMGKSAINNTVILGGELEFSYVSIYGGIDLYDTSRTTDVRLGNTLVLDDVRATVAEVANFENYSVRLSSWTGDGEAMLTIKNASINPTLTTDMTGTHFSLSVPYLAANGTLPSVGDRMALIRNTEAGLDTDGMTVTTPTLTGVKRGIAYLYDLAVETGDTSIDAVVTGKRLNPQTKSLSEGRVAALSINNRGGDLVAGSALGRAARAAMRGKTPSGMETFFAMSAGHARQDTGSHVDVDGLSTLAGVAGSLLKDRSLVLGGFVENGWGSYTAANGFADAPSVRAKGDASYYGGGLLGIYDLASCGLRGFSVNGALRAGRQDADYRSGDLTDGAGNAARYNISSPYFGAHVGVSHACNVSGKVGLESYTRFLWTRLYGDHADVCGDDVRFRSVDSQRIQAGARVHYEATARVRPFVGASYEWECGGTARATTHGDGITAPSLRGGTGVGELGVLFQPVAGKSMFIEAGMNGYVGKREGFGGNVRFTVEF